MIGTLLLREGQAGQPWQVQTHNVVDAGLLCAGLQPEQALALVGRVFGLCRVAHRAAGIRAMGLAGNAGPDHVCMQDEILQDHALALLVTLPAHLNLPPQRESLCKVLQDRQAGPAMARELIGTNASLAQMNAQAFEAWLATGQTETGAFLPRLFKRCQSALDGVGATVDMAGLTPQAVQARLAHEGVQPVPTMAYDASIWPDYAHYPVMQALVGAGGVTPFARLVARLLEFLACLEGRVDTMFARVAPFMAGMGAGVGVARAARGMLVHAVQVRNGLVAEYQILSPTFWHMAEGGLFRQAISRLNPVCTKMSVECVLAALNPCVPVTLEAAQHA
ncbi:nickel-dependent hydrogenase large subunit [Acetobacter sp.]|uniref:nickel-dependent hydrogenase large subunit n=1 Tax=Acetobacter sp. TaxID=440 RepID=UPI0039EC38AF